MSNPAFEPDPSRTDTGADFIGSILIDFDENGDFTAERRYKPYGELLAGTATTYGWTGNTGSRATLLQYAEQYNRRRHVSTKLKQWSTRDPLWPDESAYGYVRGGPLTWSDPTGQVTFDFRDFQRKGQTSGDFLIGPRSCAVYTCFNKHHFGSWNSGIDVHKYQCSTLDYGGYRRECKKGYCFCAKLSKRCK